MCVFRVFDSDSNFDPHCFIHPLVSYLFFSFRFVSFYLVSFLVTVGFFDLCLCSTLHTSNHVLPHALHGILVFILILTLSHSDLIIPMQCNTIHFKSMQSETIGLVQFDSIHINQASSQVTNKSINQCLCLEPTIARLQPISFMTSRLS